jgi:hypothetical protein
VHRAEDFESAFVALSLYRHEITPDWAVATLKRVYQSRVGRQRGELKQYE